MNMPLKLKIIEKFESQTHFAAAIGEDEAKISKVIRGWRKLSQEDQKKWAKVLSCNPQDIFHSNE